MIVAGPYNAFKAFKTTHLFNEKNVI